MISFRLTMPSGDAVFVSLATTALDEPVRIQLEGPASQVQTIRWMVEGATGPRATALGDTTTARHLKYAMRHDVLLAQCQPTLVTTEAGNED